MGSAILLGALVAWSCTGDSKGRPDKDLGDLVLSPAKEVPSVNLSEVSEDHDALFKALSLSHGWVSSSLGPHRISGTSKVVVKQGGTLVEELEDTLFIDIDGEDRFVATLDNSKDYGRHAIYDGSSLYLRPRFGKYHARAPQTEEEAVEIRNQIFAGATDYLDLFRSQLEVSDKGQGNLEGRAVRLVALKLAPQPHKKRVPETTTQRMWRNSIQAQSLEGQVSFDTESGAALAIEFRGSVQYVRDKQSFVMTVEAKRSVVQIGHERVIAAPEKDLVLRIPARVSELAERDGLLQGIAPPARKAPTPKPQKAP